MDSSNPEKKEPPASAEELRGGTRIGWVTGLGVHGRIKVDFDGNRHGPIEARMATLVDAEMLKLAVEQRQKAVLHFEDGDPLRPILLGLIHEPSETPLLDAVLLQPLPADKRKVVVDGRPVPPEALLLEGRDELILRCGKASLILRRNGQVLLQGTNIQVDAGTLLRLRGGKTQIN